MGERLTNVNILEAEHDGLKYLELNDTHDNFRKVETQATAMEGADPIGQQPKIQEDDEEPVTNLDRAKATKIETNDQINCMHSEAMKADAVNNEFTEEINVTLDYSTINKGTEANKKMIKIMAQIRTKKSENSVANNLRAKSNAVEEKDFPEERQFTNTLSAAIPEMGGDIPDYDARQINTIQEKEEKEISQNANSRKLVRKSSEFYPDQSCDLKKSSQRMFLTQTKTRRTGDSVTELERRHLELKSGFCYPEEICAYSEIVKTVRLIHLLSIF